MENTLQQKIEEAEKKGLSQVSRTHLLSADKSWLNKINAWKNELEEIREQKLKGSLVRSRAQYVDANEKPFKFFLNLENNNFISKHIMEIKKGDTSIRNPNEILNEMHSFYQSLYNHKNTTGINESLLFKNLPGKMSHLNEQDKLTLDAEIPMQELETIILKSQNNKSPGTDGFSNEFFRILWPHINMILLKLMKSYRDKGTIDQNHNMGIITCIPKGGKLHSELKNWRPITLLNSLYNFFSAILAERIKLILPKLINTVQKGFMNGRFISENSRLIHDVINKYSLQNLKGLIILIDFEKAFNSLSWEFIRKSLEIFNFNNITLNWVKSLQENSASEIFKMVIFRQKIT